METTSPRPAERVFYLAEFRGRSLGMVLADGMDVGPDLQAVLAELAENPTRCVLISPNREGLEALCGVVTEPDESPAWPGRVWHAIDADGRVGIHVASGEVGATGASFAVRCRQVTLKLKLSKLVWVQGAGGLVGDSGERISLVDLEELRSLQADPEPAGSLGADVLHEIGVMLEAGTPSISLCSAEGVLQELFTYSGSGTLFTKERYTQVRDLGLDDFDAAADLIRVGTEDGFLLSRSPEEIRFVLSHAFGVFIEGRYLAGIGALLPYPDDGSAEIASLYTVTRFAKEGVGGHLLSYSLEKARNAGLARIFACTTSERVEDFFRRHGFETVPMDALPQSKWKDYSEERISQVTCLARNTNPAAD
ncbi:MAG: GNAT family N-acetyltransferase [Myxococcota bacterium]|nr:GNAT family N-acetyltransferase [Myxococcota bacterium]